ncbi:MAG: polyribonucleotide nucleotidyltransferase [Acidobacteria bacterium]|nr:polyribonucleotide nucleotidyltransferase [Acidobacteriota bacterium]
MEIAGQTLSIESGEMAKQADGAVVVRYGDTMVLVTAVADKAEKEFSADPFIPLTVDYREYTYSAGKIPGGFFKREGRPSTKEILTCRLIDRPLRPLFPGDWTNETQIIALVISADTENNPDILGLIGASAALGISVIPFGDIVGAVRVGMINGEFIAFPKLSQMDESDLDLVLAGTEKAITMVESGSNEISEDQMIAAINFGHEVIKDIIALQKRMIEKIAPRKLAAKVFKFDEELYKEIESRVTPKIKDALGIKEKLERRDVLSNVFKEEMDLHAEEDEEKQIMAQRILVDIKVKIFRSGVLNDRIRFDGRAFNQIRQITSKVAILPRTHGSALFTRGETQAMVSATLGTEADEQIVDNIQEERAKRFMLHYNFPPFSVGEAKILRGPGRREIGHGALAERAIQRMMPSEEDFPYVVRVVSDILESNGSSSMASICGGVLALMDAGVPLKSPVAGIAMGLVMEGDKYAILSDIAGEEDHYGDMDFKVGGTENGITALQMDIKVDGLTPDIMAEALEQAKEGRLFILGKMLETIQEPRAELSPYAPRAYTLQVPEEKIREIIGPGGKMIKSIIAETGVKIDIDDTGLVRIYAADAEKAQAAIDRVEALSAVPELNKVYTGKVVRIVDFGAFVNILPGTDGLLHVSEIAPYRVNNVTDELAEGDEIEVKVIGLDDGKVRLSRKALLPQSMQDEEHGRNGEDRRESRDRGDSRGRRDDRKRDSRRRDNRR